MKPIAHAAIVFGRKFADSTRLWSLALDSNMTDKQLVVTTAPNLSDARRLAHAIVDRKIAACVNIVPKIESIYRWEGKVESAEECLLLIKTTAGLFERVRSTIQELHSYQVPECIALAIEAGSLAYLKWITDSVEDSPMP